MNNFDTPKTTREKEGFAENSPELNLLNLLKDHKGADLHRIINNGTDPISQYIKSLSSDSPILIPEILDETTANNSEALYEKIIFIQKYPEINIENYNEILNSQVAQIIETDKNTKWKDMVEPLFDNENLEEKIKSLLKNIGFIPTEILTKQKFKNIDIKNIVTTINILSALDKTELIKESRHERAKLLNHLFISKQANKIKNKDKENITLDTNGIFINLKGLHSHLPYGLISEELFNALEQDNWMNTDKINEAKIRTAQENIDKAKQEEFKKQQLLDFKSNFQISESDLPTITDKLINKITKDPDLIARQINKQDLIIPDILIEEILSSQDKNKIYSLIRLSEAIGAEIINEDLRQAEGLFDSHKIMGGAKQSYEARNKILNHPDYYNTLKITNAFLESNIKSDPENNFLVFRGEYKKSTEGDQHSFIELLHEGNLARILISERKHLGPNKDDKLKHLELFNKEEYENLENALRVFNYYSDSVNRIEKILLTKNKNWDTKFKKLTETCLHFLLTNNSANYQEANNLHNKIETSKDINETDYNNLLNIFKVAKADYSKFFYKNIQTSQKFSEQFSPEIKKQDLQYGSDFLKQAEQELIAKNFNTELCSANIKTRIVTIDYKITDPTQTIPFHIEESCLDALRIVRDRPLINIIGGCDKVKKSEDEISPLDKFSIAVMKTAHKHKANVGIPGTQSGVGNAFGKQNILYQEQTETLPHRDKAHLFAINPGGNAFFPGNKYLKNTPQEEIFANTTVDTIITPTSAGWEKVGREKYNSPYLNHVAYMESLYQRTGADQPKVMVVGDGGLYSIAEINESLKRGLNLILIKDSGRFAEAVATIIKQIDSLNIPTEHIEQYHKTDQNITNNFSREIINAIKTLDPEVKDEFLKKDFGYKDIPENEDYEVYRTFFFRFLQLAKKYKDKIKISSLDNLETDLDQYLSQNF